MLTRNKPFAKRDGGSRIASFERVDDDGRFCLVRVTAVADDIRGADDVALVVTSHGRERQLAPVDLDPQSGDDRSAEFLLPSRMLESAELALAVGPERLPLPQPDPAQAASSSTGVSTERALFVQHDQLADQGRRLAQLRTELRRARDRASEAEDALDKAEGRFEIALLAQRQEVQDARERATRAEDGRAADRSALETLEAEVAAAREALDRERAVRFEVEGRALEAEQAIAATREELATSRAAAANAVAQADAMRRALEDERGMRSDSEVRLTWAEARLEDKAERIAELEEEARRRGVELDAERAAEVQRARALDDELAAARDATERERTVRVKAEGRALEWEQSAGAVKIELDRSWEAAVAAVAEVDAVRRVLEEERSGRAEAEARLEERSARSDRLEQELAAAEEQRQALEVALSEAQAALAEQPAAVVEPEPEPELAAETPAEEPAAEQPAPPDAVLPGTIGARLIALDMALNGTPREETARYLEDTVAAEDEREALLDELYAHRTATA